MNREGLCSKLRTNPEPNTKHGKTACRHQTAGSVSCDSEGGPLGERPCFGLRETLWNAGRMEIRAHMAVLLSWGRRTGVRGG